jgi:hypothetical protein
MSADQARGDDAGIGIVLQPGRLDGGDPHHRILHQHLALAGGAGYEQQKGCH